jgi:hypothetical protein
MPGEPVITNGRQAAAARILENGYSRITWLSQALG